LSFETDARGGRPGGPSSRRPRLGMPRSRSPLARRTPSSTVYAPGKTGRCWLSSSSWCWQAPGSSTGWQPFHALWPAMSSGTATACRSRSTCRRADELSAPAGAGWPPLGGAWGLPLAAGEPAELGMNGAGELHQLAAVEATGKRISQRAVDPIEGGAIAALGKAEGSVRETGLLAHVKRQAPSGRILVHELRGGLVAVGQQPAADELPALRIEFGCPHVRAKAARQP